MGRPVMLGNGSLTVGLNESGLVHDFYYPYVGLDNLTTARSMDHKVGVWVDNTFSWVDGESWEIQVDFERDALVSLVVATNKQLNVTLEFSDFVDHELNAFCRRITVKNLADHERTIRLFMHQVFQISRGGRGDTALFVPDDHYILDYKGRCSLLIYGQTANGQQFDQFSVGNYGIEDKLGTYKDAEDGELTGNAVEHGGVDSVIRFSLELAGKEESKLDYWIVAADSQYTAEKVHNKILSDGVQARLEETRHNWYEWLDIARDELQSMSENERTLVKKSLMVIRAHTDKRGGIIASCDSSIYNYGRDYYSYVWPRDGAYAMWPLIRLGYQEEPKKFFEFCRDILTTDGYLMHKYQPDRAIARLKHLAFYQAARIKDVLFRQLVNIEKRFVKEQPGKHFLVMHGLRDVIDGREASAGAKARATELRELDVPNARELARRIGEVDEASAHASHGRYIEFTWAHGLPERLLQQILRAVQSCGGVFDLERDRTH